MVKVRSINWVSKYLDLYIDSFNELVKSDYFDDIHSKEKIKFYRKILTRYINVKCPFDCILYTFNNKYFKLLLNYYEGEIYFDKLKDSVNILNDEFNELLTRTYNLERIKFC